MFRKNSGKKVYSGLFLIIFTVVSLFSFLSYPRVASAAIPASIVFTVETVINRITDFVKNSLVTTLMRAGMNTAQLLVQRLAYDAAVWVGSGGQGQGPLFQHKDAGEYFADLGGTVAGEFLGDLNRDFSEVFNLCNPPDPQLKLQLKLGIFNSIQPRKPKCDIYETAKNWQRMAETAKAGFLSQFEPKQFLGMIQSSFMPDNNDIGMMLSITDKLQANAQLRISESLLNRGVKDGNWQDYVNTVSKRIETPRSVVSKNFEKNLIDTPADQRNAQWLATYITGAVRPETYPSALIATFTSTFINTLGSELQKRLMEGLFKALNPTDSSEKYTGVAFSGRRAVEASFSDLQKPPIITEANVDYLSEFASCPDRYPGINNCVIDQEFQRAILHYHSTGKGLTLREAIDKKFLKGDSLIYPRNHIKNDQESDEKGIHCFRDGYCYRNLVRLRRARIIPVGWEMVADLCNRETNPPGVNCSISNPPTLEEVMNNFNTCDPSNSKSIFCHLIDPEWVLKAPSMQCLAKVSGALLEGPEASSRQDVCVDDASCIVEDDRGSCKAYGYCTREKNIWRFGGELCEARFESCSVYKDTEGQELSVLDKTIDPGICDGSNAGCVWYSVAKKVVSGSSDWTDDTPQRIAFNSQVKTCDESSDGCRKFIRTGAGLGTNLLVNSSFEINDDFGLTLPDGWLTVGNASSVQYSTDGTKAYDGVAGIFPGSDGVYQQINVLPKHSYVFSAYAMNTALVKGEAILEIQLRLGDKPFKTLTDRFELSNSTTHDRISYPFEIDTALDAVDNALIVLKQNSSSASIWFDSVMFEEIEPGDFLATSYKEYGTAQTIALKKAPDYLGCYKDWSSFGSDVNCTSAGGDWDNLKNICSPPEKCSKYVAWCKKSEVGCNMFKPVLGDSPSIAGTPFGDDYCPSECAGYSSYVQQGTFFEDGGSLDFLIAKTARQCSLDQVGCDEFTNLESESSGRAENKEYFSFLRQCIKNDSSCKTFYTWEGSDTEGYQLRTFILQSENIQGGGIGGGPALLGGGLKPKTIGIDTCDEQKFKSQAYPDCRQFYYVDGTGRTHITYASLSKTVACSDDCTSYRKTLSGGKAECEKYSGKWIVDQQLCIYQGLPRESRQCTQQSAGCREYKGNTGNNIRTVFYDDFETGTNDGWDGGQNSNVAVKDFAHSVWNKVNATLTKDVTSVVNKGNSYMLTFWARSRGKEGATLTVGYSNQLDKNSPLFDNRPIGTVRLKDTWSSYTVGPIVLRDAEAFVNKVSLHFSGVALNELYVDMVQLQEITDRVFLVKNSWNTPVSCDNNNSTPYGRLGLNNPTRDNPQAQLACREYTDQNNKISYLKSFSRLCRDEAVGCEALIDTQNSTSPFAWRYNVLCDSVSSVIDIVKETCILKSNGDKKYSCKLINGATKCFIDKVPYAGIVFQGQGETQVLSDKVEYLVNSRDAKCSVTALGCMEVGRPKLNADNNLDTTLSVKERWESLYLLNQPDTYDNILCSNDELFCKEYTSKNAKRYFKDPGKRTCEYRSNVRLTVGGQVSFVNGWFKVNVSGPTPEPCYPNNLTTLDLNNPKSAHGNIIGSWDILNDQKYYIVPKSNKKDYAGWVGLCPQSQNLCTLFVDPLGTSDPTKSNKDDISHYFYLNNNSVDTKSCNGQASIKDGCILFDDTSNAEKLYHSGATYKESSNKNNEAVNPVNCEVTAGSTLPISCKDFGSATNTVGLKSDSNTVIKVKRDRTCGEWLTCQSSSKTKVNGSYVELCSKLTRCSQYNASVSPSYCDRSLPTLFDRLDLSYYQKRGGENYKDIKEQISWTDRDYSGYSIPNYFSLDTFSGIMFTDPNLGSESRLFHDTHNRDALGNYYGVCEKDTDCVKVKIDSTEIQPTCIERRCLLNIDGSRIPRTDSADPKSGLNTLVLQKSTPEPSCRAYPEREAPFPKDVLELAPNVFKSVNVCEDCLASQCSYKKITYGNQAVTKYFQNEPDQKGVCVGGTLDGQLCNPLEVDACKSKNDKGTFELTGGECKFYDARKFEFQGWTGYCLERDSRGARNKTINQADYLAPCLTWMPVRYMTGLKNIYENYATAGFNKTEELRYCAETTLARDVYTKSVQCAYLPETSCNNDIGARESCKRFISCPRGHFVVFGSCNSWGNVPGQDLGFCSTTQGSAKDLCPYQCVPMGSKHAIGGSFTFSDSNKIEIKSNSSCWDTAKTMAKFDSNYGIDNFGGGMELPPGFVFFNPADAEKIKSKPLYYAYISSGAYSDIVVNDNNGHGFAPSRPFAYKNLRGEGGRTVFDDCILPNVDLLDEAGLMYAGDDVDGEYKLACKTLVQVTVESKTKGSSNNKENSEWLNKAFTDRVAYDSTKYLSSDGQKVSPYTMSYDKKPINPTYLVPDKPFARASDKYVSNSTKSPVDIGKLSLTSFVNVITACRNDNIKPTYFGIGVRTLDDKGVDCGDQLNYKEPIFAMDNDPKYRPNQIKIKELYNDSTLSFYDAEFLLKGALIKDDPKSILGKQVECRQDADCTPCYKEKSKVISFICKSDSDCKIGSTDLGKCEGDPNKQQLCEVSMREYLEDADGKTYCNKDKLMDNICLSQTCKQTSDCKNGGSCIGNTCTNGELVKLGSTGGKLNYNGKVFLKVGLCTNNATICMTNSDCGGLVCRMRSVDGKELGLDPSDPRLTSDGKLAYSRCELIVPKITDKDAEITVLGEKSYNGIDTTIDTGVERLQQLYARVYGAWRLKPLFSTCLPTDTKCTSVKDKLLLIGDTDKETYPSKYPQFSYEGVISQFDDQDPKGIKVKVLDGNYAHYSWDVSDGSNPAVIPIPPQFAADIPSGFGEGKQGTVTINGNLVDVNDPLTKPMEVEEGQSVLLSFYGWADKNQMPLRRVRVAWGAIGKVLTGGRSANPDITPDIKGLYKNRRSACNPGDQEGVSGKGFGGSKEGCQEDPFIFEHLYLVRKVTQGNNDSWACEEFGGQNVSDLRVPTNKALGTTPRKACLFPIQVHLSDNWGWCTGFCENTKKFGGCYDDELKKKLNCTKPDDVNKPWVTVGHVMVYERLK